MLKVCINLLEHNRISAFKNDRGYIGEIKLKKCFGLSSMPPYTTENKQISICLQLLICLQVVMVPK